MLLAAGEECRAGEEAFCALCSASIVDAAEENGGVESGIERGEAMTVSLCKSWNMFLGMIWNSLGAVNRNLMRLQLLSSLLA